MKNEKMSGGISINRYNFGAIRKSGGLSDDMVTKSRAANGDNKLRSRKGKGFWKRFLSNLGDPVIRILLGALVINVIFMFRRSDWLETAGIAVSVFLATFISTMSEYGSEAAFRRLSEESANTLCRVRRNGETVEILSDEIVVGDVVLLGAGEKIPADGIITRGFLCVDQSSLTGESREAEKYPCAESDCAETLPSEKFALFRGCLILSGNAEMVVTQVGEGTFIGKISEEVQADTRESPLRVRLSKLAGQISRLGYIAAALVALVYLINQFVLDSNFDGAVIFAKITDISYVFDKLLHAFTLGLTVVVMAVPEGLPVMIAVVLSSNIKRMIKSNVLVRKPVGIEAAGSMNILFTDKTGTLTEGKLSVSKIRTVGRSYSSIEEFISGGGGVSGLFLKNCFFNNESSLGSGQNGKPAALGGNSTDRALLQSVAEFADFPGRESKVSARCGFDSTRKFSAVSVGETVYIKGAPDVLLKHISGYTDEEGKTRRIESGELRRLTDKMTEGGRRVLAFAYFRAESRDKAVGTVRLAAEGKLPDMTFICCVALEDRIRPEAANAIARMRGAGIQVVMITGDGAQTAAGIAGQCGILGDGCDIVLESSDMNSMSDRELREMLPRIAVIARALPSDKSRLVRIAEDSGLVVGMTGDGINDAPALKRADVGFAMGDGTQVAKDAGDIIILDNNIDSIAQAVLYGRNIFKSIRKFIALQLMMNFCAVGISMICPFLGVDTPVTMIQMLWINIVMDTLGGLAFAGEPPMESCMSEPPKRRDEPILNRYMINEIVFQGGFTVALLIFFLKSKFVNSLYRHAPDDLYVLTAFFALFIFSSVFNCFNARTDRLKLLSGIEGNRPFVWIMTLILLIQLVFVYVGGSVLRTAPLTLRELAITSAFALCVFPADMIRKLLLRLSGKRQGY